MFARNLYFRLKGQNANIYRLVKEHKRPGDDIFQHIGTLVTHNGQAKLKDGEMLSPEEEAEVKAWLKQQAQRDNVRSRDGARKLIPEINLVTHWMQSTATDEEVSEIFEELVLALTDMRETAIRRYAKARLHAAEKETK